MSDLSRERRTFHGGEKSWISTAGQMPAAINATAKGVEVAMLQFARSALIKMHQPVDADARHVCRHRLVDPPAIDMTLMAIRTDFIGKYRRRTPA